MSVRIALTCRATILHRARFRNFQVARGEQNENDVMSCSVCNKSEMVNNTKSSNNQKKNYRSSSRRSEFNKINGYGFRCCVVCAVANLGTWRGWTPLPHGPAAPCRKAHALRYVRVYSVILWGSSPHLDSPLPPATLSFSAHC